MCLKELLLLLCICFFCCCYLLIQKDIVNLGVSTTSLQPFEPIKMQFKALLVRLSPQFTKKIVYMRILIIIIVFFFVVCSLYHAQLCHAVTRGKIRGDQTSETSRETQEEPGGQPGDYTSPTS